MDEVLKNDTFRGNGVRRRVPLAALIRLANDHDIEVRINVATNPNTPSLVAMIR